ncbi:MAG: hypothetical protein N2487_01705 [Verrucomicrobiae bacterium]|nr:hypothetical protein [Verrucomicrobiae bacterium]
MGNNFPASVDFAGWVGCLAFFVMFLNGILKLADRARGKPPQPPNAALGADFQALSQRVGKLEIQVETIRMEMKNDRDTLMRAGEERAIKINDRINALGERLIAAVAELRGELKRLP